MRACARRSTPSTSYRLERPLYEFEAQPGTRIRNGHSIRAFSLALAAKVQGHPRSRARFPVVIGGDCSVLLGSLLWRAAQAGGRGLVHVDGHSDFAQEKSYATPQTLGAAAGMDLALASGRGEALLTDWPEVGVRSPRTPISIQVGERAPEPAVVHGVLRRHPVDRDHAHRRQDVLAGGIEAAARARDRAPRRTRPRPGLAARRPRRAGREGDAGGGFAGEPRLRLPAARRTRWRRSWRPAASPAPTSRSTIPSATRARPCPRARAPASPPASARALTAGSA